MLWGAPAGARSPHGGGWPRPIRARGRCSPLPHGCAPRCSRGPPRPLRRAKRQALGVAAARRTLTGAWTRAARPSSPPWGRGKRKETERIGAGEARGLGASANITSPLPCRVVLPVAAEWFSSLSAPRGADAAAHRIRGPPAPRPNRSCGPGRPHSATLAQRRPRHQKTSCGGARRGRGRRGGRPPPAGAAPAGAGARAGGTPDRAAGEGPRRPGGRGGPTPDRLAGPRGPRVGARWAPTAMRRWMSRCWGRRRGRSSGSGRGSS